MGPKSVGFARVLAVADILAVVPHGMTDGVANVKSSILVGYIGDYER